MGRLTIDRVSHTFSTRKDRLGVKVLDNISFEVKDRGFLCLLGPSGCGKTTLLRITAGLEPLKSGDILLNDIPIVGPDPKRGMMFQQYSLFPWRKIIDNITFGLEMQGRQTRETLREKVHKYIDLVGLNQFKDCYPHELSGGMQQRAAIARALVNEPDVLLMDEPFGSLDAQTRNTLQVELLKIWNKKNITLFFVTHSVDEAVFLADEIIVMTARPGTIREVINVDLPHPRNRTSPEANYIRDKVLRLLQNESKSHNE